MAKQFYIRLQTGIAGGFAPPNPTSVQQITSSLNDGGTSSILLQTTTRDPDQRRLPDEPTAQSTFKHDAVVDNATKEKVGDRVSKLVGELEAILRKLPTESPPGSKDIYGMDIGLTFGSDNVEWMNGGPQGCGGGVSDVEATDAEREEFKKALAIVDELVKLGQVDTATA